MFACKTRYTHPCWLGKFSGYLLLRWQSAKCKRTTWLWRGVLEFGWHPHKRCHFDSVKSFIPWRGDPAQRSHILATGLVGGALRSKVGYILFCFVLFLRPRSPKPGCFMPGSWYLWKTLDEWGCTWLGMELPCGKLLIIEPFSQWKFNKIEIENCIGICRCSWCCWKALGEPDLIEFYFTIFTPKVWKILVFEWILLLKIQTNCKNWVWKKKISWASMCSHCQI
jgi:hypothetical protein